MRTASKQTHTPWMKFVKECIDDVTHCMEMYPQPERDYIVRAVNAHEDLLQNLKNARAAISVLSADTQTRLMDEIDEAINKAERKS